MDALEADIEMAPGEEEIARERAFSEVEGEDELNLDDREEEDGEDRHPLDRDESGVDGSAELESDEDEPPEDEIVTVGGVQYNIGGNKRKRASEVEVDGEDIKMGETVTAGEYTWKRVAGIEEDSRKEPHFKTIFKNNLFNADATEVEIFRALMPLGRDALLNIIRDNAEDENDGRVWLGWHVDAALAIIFGGAQFKEGTDLWATGRVGLMPGPDFGRHLSHDRFNRKYNCWQRHLSEVERQSRDEFAI